MFADTSTTLLKRRDAVATACLVLLAIAYYGQYYADRFNIADEGSLLLICSRLLQGDRPYLDVEIGYGPLWYYPLVLIFKMTGVSFRVARVFFLGLAVGTALLAYLMIIKHTGRRWLASLAAFIVILVPGTLHKTYIPLIVLANMLFCLPRMLQAAASRTLVLGIVLALSYSIRPELGMCSALILVPALVTRALVTSRNSRGGSRRKLLLNLLCLIVGGVLAMAPLFVAAHRQNIAKPLLEGLSQPIHSTTEVIALIRTGSFLHHAESEARAERPGRVLSRASLSSLWSHSVKASQKRFVALTFLPLLTLGALILSIPLTIVSHQRRNLYTIAGDIFAVLAPTLLAFSAFPQFFLYRPDIAHLSQFMPGYIVLMALVLGGWTRRSPQDGGGPLPSSARLRFKNTWRLLLGTAFVANVGLYLWHAVSAPATGSMALARNQSERFVGGAGIDTFVSPGRQVLFETVVRLANQHTQENDFVLCFPYCPGLNLVADRPTLAKRLYVDDSLLLLDPGWQRRTMRAIDSAKPGLIIVQDWAINGTEISRFENWALDLMRHIASTYYILEKRGSYTFYGRLDSVDEERFAASPLALRQSTLD